MQREDETDRTLRDTDRNGYSRPGYPRVSRCSQNRHQGTGHQKPGAASPPLREAGRHTGTARCTVKVEHSRHPEGINSAYFACRTGSMFRDTATTGKSCTRTLAGTGTAANPVKGTERTWHDSGFRHRARSPRDQLVPRQRQPVPGNDVRSRPRFQDRSRGTGIHGGNRPAEGTGADGDTP